MPPHHHLPKFKDYWWNDMPDAAKKAARVLGYSKLSWDKDEEIPYDAKEFTDLSYNEKAAALFLSMDSINSKLDDAYWKDLDEETKKHAVALGWDEHKWDHDWEIHHLECEHWWWKDLNDEQLAAAKYFGYNNNTWDYLGLVEFSLNGVQVDAEDEEAAAKMQAEQDAADEEAIKQEEEQAEASGQSPAQKPTTKPSKGKKKSNGDKKFAISKFFGSEGGSLFDHRNHRFIEKIEVWESKVVHGLKVTYANHKIYKAGSEEGKHHTLELKNDFINKVEVREAESGVQALTFYTKKGEQHGPWGGHGRMMDKKGETKTVVPPKNMCLCGFLGRSGKRIDAVAFRWGPTDTVPMK